MKLEIDVAPILENKLVVDTVTLLEHLALAWQEDTDESAMISALETALCLARDLERNSGETVRTSRRTHNINWNSTPERRFMKCILGALIRTGLPKSDLLAKFKKLVPDFQTFFDSPVSDSALWGRADTGRRGGKYRNENPDIHPLTLPYWPIAVAAVEANQPLTADDVRRLVCPDNEQVEEQEQEDEVGEEAQDEPASDSPECVPVAGLQQHAT